MSGTLRVEDAKQLMFEGIAGLEDDTFLGAKELRCCVFSIKRNC